MVGGGNVGGNDIFYGNKITGLFARAVDRDWGVALGAVGEDADDAAVGRVGALAGAVDIEISEAGGAEIEEVAVVADVVFTEQFLGAVH